MDSIIVVETTFVDDGNIVVDDLIGVFTTVDTPMYTHYCIVCSNINNV